jgi:CheY-like chemotaxis protein
MNDHIQARPNFIVHTSPSINSAIKLRRILVTDDDEINRFILADYLRTKGHRVGTASNGAEAVEAVLGATYDVVLLDLHMPILGGEEAMRQIRALGENIHQPYIIVLSAFDISYDFQRYRKAGMNDFRCKPVSLRALAELIEQIKT